MGVTSNPAIFEKAITGSNDYSDAAPVFAAAQGPRCDGALRTSRHPRHPGRHRRHASRLQFADQISRMASSAPEVSPIYAHDTQKTIDEARRLWKAVDRPNLMVKVPATHGGNSRHRAAASSEGININITPCSLRKCAGRRWRSPTSPDSKNTRPRVVISSKMACVASFFVSRIDSLIDSQTQRPS